VPAEGIVLGPGTSYSCAFGAEVVGNAADTETGTLTAVAVDDEGNRIEASDSATVTVTDVAPAIAVVKTAAPDSLPEPGGPVEFRIRVTNQGVEGIELATLVDSVHGDLNGKGSCVVSPEGRVLGPGQSYECAFNAVVSGAAGASETNTVTAAATDDEGNRVEAVDSTTVTIAGAPRASDVVTSQP
jgi:hypothetical protein